MNSKEPVKTPKKFPEEVRTTDKAIIEDIEGRYKIIVDV